MKVAIVGSMGVGKTTLVNELAKELGWRVLPEIAREMAKAGYKLDQGIDVNTEYEMMKMQVKLEEHIGPWIADRCLIDIQAYSMVLFPKDIHLLKAIKRELDRAKYDIILYIPPEFSLMSDGVRQTDIDFRNKVDEEIKKILKPRQHFIIRGSVEKRVRKVINIINQKP